MFKISWARLGKAIDKPPVSAKWALIFWVIAVVSLLITCIGIAITGDINWIIGVVPFGIFWTLAICI